MGVTSSREPANTAAETTRGECRPPHRRITGSPDGSRILGRGGNVYVLDVATGTVLNQIKDVSRVAEAVLEP